MSEKIEPQIPLSGVASEGIELDPFNVIMSEKIEPDMSLKGIPTTMDLSKPIKVKKNLMSIEDRVLLHKAKEELRKTYQAAEEVASQSLSRWQTRRSGTMSLSLS